MRWFGRRRYNAPTVIDHIEALLTGETTMSTKRDNELQTLGGGINPKELGPALIKQAQDQDREATQKMVVSGVSSIMKDIQAKRQLIERSKEQLEKQEKRLNALNAGDFTVRYDFNNGGPQIVFNDKDLQSERSL